MLRVRIHRFGAALTAEGSTGVAGGVLPLAGVATGAVRIAGRANGVVPLSGLAAGAARITGMALGGMPLGGSAIGYRTGEALPPRSAFPAGSRNFARLLTGAPRPCRLISNGRNGDAG